MGTPESRVYIAKSLTRPTEGFKSNIVLPSEQNQSLTPPITIFEQPGLIYEMTASKKRQKKLSKKEKEEREKLDKAIKDAVRNAGTKDIPRLLEPQLAVAQHAERMARTARGEDPNLR